LTDLVEDRVQLLARFRRETRLRQRQRHRPRVAQAVDGLRDRLRDQLVQERAREDMKVPVALLEQGFQADAIRRAPQHPLYVDRLRLDYSPRHSSLRTTASPIPALAHIPRLLTTSEAGCDGGIQKFRVL